MIEKPKRPKKPDIQERQPPRTLQELISRYDLDNTKIYDFLDGLVELINTDIDNLNNQKVNKVINITSTGTNLNDYKTEGIYYFSPNYTPTNIPIGVNGWLKVIPGNDGTLIVKQIWYRHGTPNSNDYETYVRTFSSNTWSNWNKLAIQSSIDNLNNNKVSKTGDTLTGELIFNNKSDYGAIRKARTIDNVDYSLSLGVGVNKSARLEIYSGGTTYGQLDVRSDGCIWNGKTGQRLVEKNEVNFIHLGSNATTFSFSIGNLTGGFQTYIIYGGWQKHFMYLLTVHPSQQTVIGYNQIFNNTGEANINSVTISNNVVTVKFSSTIWGGVHIIGEQAQST